MTIDRYRYFRVEARELLDLLGQGVLDAEKGAPSADAVARLLRFAHTLKGAARVVREREIADDAHALEDALAAFRGATTPISKVQIDRVLTVLDGIGRKVAALSPPSSVAASPESRRFEEHLPTFRPDITDMDALIEGVTQAHVQLGSMRLTLERAEHAGHLLDLLVGQIASPRMRASALGGDGQPGGRARAIVEDLRQSLGGLERDVAYGVEQIDRELREVRETAERLRLVRVGVMFVFLERVARDAAQVLGKPIVFDGRGGDVRVDPAVLGVVQGALLHLVSNAVVHGIESVTGERAATGKAPSGRVTVDVSRRGERVVFACHDDGRGIDLEAVRQVLERRGLARGEVQQLDADALFGMLLRGGISTTGTVTNVAGRGIGLDVVREAAERLGGHVSMRTEPGKGTTVELIVPLAIGAFEALIVGAADVTAVVPLDAVRRTVRVAPEEIVSTPRGEAILSEAEAIPLVPLARILGVTARLPRVSGPVTAFVVQSAHGRAAFSVDRILDTANVLVRPLPDLAPAARVVAGTSLDALGNARLVLDPEVLVADADHLDAVDTEPQAPRRSILVIDDSLTTRMLEQSILESAGYRVDVASSGEEALVKARQTHYALFLVDVEMPGMDGFTFIEQARADPLLAAVPSILVTSRNSPDDRQRGHDVGARAYIVKSEFDQGFLVERVRALVE